MISRIVVVVLLVLWAVASSAMAHDPQEVKDLSFTTFQVTYDNTLGIPVYVQWDITPEDLGTVSDAHHGHFVKINELVGLAPPLAIILGVDISADTCALRLTAPLQSRR